MFLLPDYFPGEVDKLIPYDSISLQGGVFMPYNNQPNPDDRSDNVEKLQEMIVNTDDNIRKAEATMDNLSGDDKAQVEAKNERRRESIEAMRSEIRDENGAR